MKRSFAVAAALCLNSLVVDLAHAQDEHGPRLGKPVTQRWQIGLVIKANSQCTGIFATTPIPIDWPEQTVKVVSEELAPATASVGYRTLEGGVKQLLLRVPRLAAGEEAKALITIDVTKHEILPPDNTARFLASKKIPEEAVKFLAPSPSIESQHVKIKALVKELLTDKKDAAPWQQVEALYDGARAKITFRADDSREYQSVIAALAKGEGDCEELTALFVALCRANRIPARCVWVNSHTYPEFFLQDEDGAGHWFPCQAAGEREFGGIRDQQPILQKGDNFKVPEIKLPQRYVQVHLEVKDVKGAKPVVMEVRKLVATQ